MGDTKMPANKDEAQGRAREAYGNLTGDKSEVRKGKIEQASGKMKEGAEKLKEFGKDVINRTNKP